MSVYNNNKKSPVTAEDWKRMFDTVIDRSGSGDLKHGALLPRWGRDDLLPLWVADMDFATPQFITDALRNMVNDFINFYLTIDVLIVDDIQEWAWTWTRPPAPDRKSTR